MGCSRKSISCVFGRCPWTMSFYPRKSTGNTKNHPIEREKSSEPNLHISVGLTGQNAKINHKKITKQWVYKLFYFTLIKMESWGPTFTWLENHQRLGAMAGVFVGRVAVEARQVGGLQLKGKGSPLVESKFFWMGKTHNCSKLNGIFWGLPWSVKKEFNHLQIRSDFLHERFFQKQDFSPKNFQDVSGIF